MKTKRLDYTLTNIFKYQKTKKVEYIDNIPKRYYQQLSKRQNSTALIKWASQLPWTKASKANLNLKNARAVLNQTHYGLAQVKERILKYLASLKFAKPTAVTPVLCLVGKPGIGKTSILLSLAKALKRELINIPPSIASDDLSLMGQDSQKPGAEPGAIIKELIEKQANNPIILFDEIDKLNLGHAHGSYASLLNIFDNHLNRQFYDNYLQIPFDLSQSLIVTTANEIDEIPPILRDRLEIINLPAYTLPEKVHIAQHFLLKRLYKQYFGLKKEFLSFKKETLETLILNYTFESGVRRLDLLLQQIIQEYLLKVSTENKFFKLVVTPNNLLKWLKNVPRLNFKQASRKETAKSSGGVVNTLVLVANGVFLKTIETTFNRGDETAIDVIQADKDFVRGVFLKTKAWAVAGGADWPGAWTLNFPETYGAINGEHELALAVSMLGAIKNIRIDKTWAFLGGTSLKGAVLPIGAENLRTLINGAYENGIKALVLSRDNKLDLKLVPTYLLNAVKIYFVATLDELVKLLFVQCYDAKKNIVGTEKIKKVTKLEDGVDSNALDPVGDDVEDATRNVAPAALAVETVEGEQIPEAEDNLDYEPEWLKSENEK